MFGLRRRRQVPTDDADEPDLPLSTDPGPMPSIFEHAATRKPDLILPEQLVGQTWRCHDGAGALLAETIRFHKDGRIVGLGDADARAWRLEDGRLLVLGADGAPRAVFGKRSQRHGLPRLEGGEGATARALSVNRRDLVFASVFGGAGQSLMIRFAPPARTAEAADPSLVAWHDVADIGLDRLAFTETLTPACWFLDKTARVIQAVKANVPPGTGRLVLAGSGATGFIAMMFAELLSGAVADVEVATVTVNPLSAIDAESQAEATAAGPAFPADRIDPDALALADTWFADVVRTRDTVRRHQGGISHAVLFDAANPCAAFHAARLGGLAGATCHPYELGLAHAEGARAIVATGQPRNALLAALGT